MQIWRNTTVTAASQFRPPLHQAEVWPRPLQQPIRVWHGSATSRESVDPAARYGDPLFSANVTNPIEPYAELVRYYRERWATTATTPPARVGAGTAGYFAPAVPGRAGGVPAGLRGEPALQGQARPAASSPTARTPSTAARP